MATQLVVDRDHLVVRLSLRDRIFALRGDVRIPVREIESVRAIGDGRRAVTGVRAPGLGVPFARMIGSWRTADGTTFAVVRGSRPAVVVTTHSRTPRRIVVSDERARRRAAQLRAKLSVASR